ncbi:MAG: HAD family hydrolase [Acidimicrobiia bacterium]|nr:HAD family hydrolase [Acidimicrobiia bacterium]
MSRRAFVFDLFHTLANPEDYRPRDFDRIEQASAAVGLDPAVVKSHWLANLHLVATSRIEPVDVLRELCDAAGISAAERQFAAADTAIGRFQDDALRQPIPGSVDTLDALRNAGWLIGLLSNAHVRDIKAWDESPLDPLIDVAHFSCYQGVAKPDLTAYTQILAELEVAPEEAVFVGDGGSNELAGANAAGFGHVVLMAGPALDSGFRTQEDVDLLAEDATAVINSVRDLPALSERISAGMR